MGTEPEHRGNILIYQNEQGDTKIDVYFEDDTVWMTQKSMAEFYQVTPQNVTLHIKHIYEEGELEEAATCKDYLQVQMEGARTVRRTSKFYDLDMILAVGYRVRGNIGSHFRRWASGVLTEYMKKGFVLNDDRLKNPREFGADYFDELLERICDIRASEKRFYQKVKDIFTLSIDYDSKSAEAQKFFKTIQDKLAYAATGHTAPELIAARADALQDNMGLTSFQGARVRRSDVTVAKNYMTQEEISKLNRLVTMYLDYAELQAQRHEPIYMAEWDAKLGKFLQFNDQDVLQGAGHISREQADQLALEQYQAYDAHRRELEASGSMDALTAQVKRLKP